MKTILVTGGAGYVGAHCAKRFAEAGWQVVCFDNLSRGWRENVRWGPLVVGDLLQPALLHNALMQWRPDIVAHFAALAYVGESVSNPDFYYRNNIVGSLNLLEAMRATGIRRLIFSSTCATYGVPQQIPIDETHPQQPINPYGWSKLMVERMIEGFVDAHELDAVILRYFNAAGGDPDGEIGERHEPETHAVPLAIAAALGGDPFRTLGTDFPTPDGTAIRDYVHVSDLADAHLAAADFLAGNSGRHIFNLGTETGTSVRELLAAVGRVVGTAVPTIDDARRPGDPAKLVAAAGHARKVLGWTPTRSDLDTIVATALRWHQHEQQLRSNGALSARRDGKAPAKTHSRRRPEPATASL